jgi:hypothetical protein
MGVQRKHKRYPTQKDRPWGILDYWSLLLAVVFALTVTVNGLFAVGRSIWAEAQQQALDAENNQPYYMTFVRGIWDAAVGQQEAEAPSLTTPTEEDTYQYNTSLDISAYANDSSYAGQLYAMREEYPQVYQILTYYDQIPEDLIKLAVNNQETMDYVAQYVTLAEEEQEIDLSAEANAEQVPLLLQWDTRWGYKTYGSGMIGYTGCGPTCLTMVALYLTGDASLNPADTAAWAEEAGYYVSGSGSAWTLMSSGCEHFGLVAEELNLNEATMVDRLNRGQPIICALGPGDFTSAGHYIVLTGYQDGAFTVNDPNSIERSNEVWTYAQLSGQIRDLWAYTLK